MGLIREYMRAAANGVSAHDFVNATNFFEIARQSEHARVPVPALRESLDDWRQRHTARQEQREFKRPLAADVALVAGPDEPRRDMADDVLQESFLARMTGRRPAADLAAWTRAHRNPR